MKISPRFYSRKLPSMIDGEMKSIIPAEHPDRARIFFRADDSDKDYPPRVCVEVSRTELTRIIDELTYLRNAMAS